MNTVLIKITSPTEAEILLNFLDQLEQNIHIQNKDVKQFIFENAPFHVAPELVGYLEIQPQNTDTTVLRQKILQLRDAIKAIPIVTLTIAFEPNEEFVYSLNQKAGELLGRKVFFELQYDATIIGGAQVEGNGKITKHTFKEYFAHRGQVRAEDRKDAYGF